MCHRYLTDGFRLQLLLVSTAAEQPEPMAISAARLKNYFIAIKPASALKKLGQLPINRGSEGVLPSVNTL
jgi:hypothetical protein